MDLQNHLKIFSGKIITESKLNKDTKIQLLNFVRESDVYEVMNILLNGKAKNLTTEDKKEVMKKFNESKELQEKFYQFLLTEAPLDLFMKQVQNAKGMLQTAGGKVMDFGDSAKNFLKTSGDYWSDKSMNMADKFPHKMREPIQKAAEKSSFSQLKSKIGKTVEWIENHIKIDGVTEKFGQAMDAIPEPVKQSPATLASAVLLAMLSAVSFAYLKKKKGEKKANQEVQKSIQAKAKKMEKDDKKAAESIAKAYK